MREGEPCAEIHVFGWCLNTQRDGFTSSNDGSGLDVDGWGVRRTYGPCHNARESQNLPIEATLQHEDREHYTINTVTLKGNDRLTVSGPKE